MTEETAQLRLIRAPEVIREDVQPLFASPNVRVIEARVVDSLERAGVAIEKAQREANRLVEVAQHEAKAIRAEAREEGRTEGLEDTLAELARARRDYQELIAGAEDDMLEMAFRLARRIIGEAVELEPQRVRHMVSNVLSHARGKREIVVQVSPDDLPVVQEGCDAFARQVDGVRVHFEADASLERGSCVIQTESGRIDGRIEAQLETLKRALRGG